MRILHRIKCVQKNNHTPLKTMHRFWRLILWGGILPFVLVQHCIAEDSKGAAIPPGFFGELESIESRSKESGFTPLTLSALKKINGEWVAEQEHLVKGKQLLEAFELKPPFSIAATIQAFNQYYTDQNAQLTFKCKGFDCGSSNAWANERFDLKQLYGLEKSQKVFVWQLDSPRVFDTVYLVQRGNRRQYALWQRIIPNDQTLSFPPDVAIYSDILDSGGEIRIEDVTIVGDSKVVFNKTQITNVAQALNAEPFRLFHVKVRAENDAVAGLVLDSFEEALVKAGVRKRRIKRVGDEFVISEGQEPLIEISWP